MYLQKLSFSQMQMIIHYLIGFVGYFWFWSLKVLYFYVKKYVWTPRNLFKIEFLLLSNIYILLSYNNVKSKKRNILDNEKNSISLLFCIVLENHLLHIVWNPCLHQNYFLIRSKVIYEQPSPFQKNLGHVSEIYLPIM